MQYMMPEAVFMTLMYYIIGPALSLIGYGIYAYLKPEKPPELFKKPKKPKRVKIVFDE